MSPKDPWPPKSPHQALLSSPSGRQKYADYRSGLGPSPTKRSAATPSLLDRLRLARQNQDYFDEPDAGNEEEDEETLQLKLAAIEAKLKLKKLQNKKKLEAEYAVNGAFSLAEQATRKSNHASEIAVPLSPTRRNLSTIEPKSPSRVVLGIDKGKRAADVSLRRANTVAESSAKGRFFPSSTSRPTSSASSAISARSRKNVAQTEQKSFSERMADSRDSDKKLTEWRERSDRGRSRALDIDHAEIEKYKAAAELRSRGRDLSPQGQDDNHDEKGTKPSCGQDQDSCAIPRDAREQGDASLYEGYSGLHLSNRILPHSFLKRTLPSDQFTIYKIPDLLRNITSPAFELPSEVADFVVFGVIASKSQPLDHKTKATEKTKSMNDWQDKWEDGSQNRKKFMAFTITDLKWTVDLYLFDTAVPRYHRLNPGTVIAILNPTIMPPRKGREDTGAFSLSLHNSEDTVLEIGSSSHLGYCNATKKDGSTCRAWVDASKSEICEWHLNVQIAKTQASRMGVNAGANGFGGKGPNNRHNVFEPRLRGDGPGSGQGHLPGKPGRALDRFTGTHYYVSSSHTAGGAKTGPPMFQREMSGARMLDLDIDDPFIAEGQLSRDREARLQKRLASQEKERQVIKHLADVGGGRGAGADYMKKKLASDAKSRSDVGGKGHGRGASDADVVSKPDAQDTSQTEDKLNDLRSRIGKKRTAQDVHLGPVKKKTRFLTSAGIKKAGGASRGADAMHGLSAARGDDNDDDDDDDLDII